MCIDLFRFKSNALDEQLIKAKLKTKKKKQKKNIVSVYVQYEAGRRAVQVRE